MIPVLLILFLPNTSPQDYARMNLPEGAVARFGKSYLREVLYSPDGARFVVVTAIGVWLYDTTTYREVALLASLTYESTSVVFGPDGKTLASESRDGAVRLCDTETGEPKNTVTEYGGAFESVAFSPDGSLLASGSWDKTVCLWDTVSWAHKQICRGHRYRIASVSFSPDGRVLASASGEGTDKMVYLWEAVTGERKGTFAGHRDAVNSVAFSPESGVLASGSSDGTVLLWKVSD